MSNIQEPQNPESNAAEGRNEQNQFRLNARLWYLMKLMRHSGPGARFGGSHGGPRGGGRRGGEFHGQGRVLRLLALHSPIPQKELAYLLGIRSQSLAELLSKLEDAGLVSRQKNTEDRRTSTVELTDKGRKVLEEEDQTPRPNPFAVLNDAEAQQLADLLDKVIEEMEVSIPEGPDERMQMFKERAFGGGAEGEDEFGPGFGGFGRGFGRGPGRGFGRGFGR